METLKGKGNHFLILNCHSEYDKKILNKDFKKIKKKVNH